MKKTFLTLFAAALCAVSAQAVTYTLDASSATYDSNPSTPLPFYKADYPGSESGTAAGYFDYSFGSTSGGYSYLEITWAPNAQPYITGARLNQASPSATLSGNNELVWDLADFALFNSGSYTAIRLVQDGIFKKNSTLFTGISHGGLEGKTNVPDSGSTLILLGATLSGLAVIARRRK